MRTGLEYESSSTPSVPQVGDVVAGKYKIERLLGRGGMGVVFAARHEVLHQPVAIKFPTESLLESESAVARFLNEGRAAAKIRSEHVARVLDVDTIPSGLPYIVLEYLHGCDLAALLSQEHFVPMRQSVDYLMQALEAVAEAHSLGLVHRDLKPANLFLVQRSNGQTQIKVLDFGISKSIGPSTSSAVVTTSQAFLGSPAYMSPEQARNAKDVDTRTDIWALGVILYELLAGEPPFTGESPIDVLSKIIHLDPPPLTLKQPRVLPGLEDVIRRCLQRERSARYQTALDLAEALLPFGTRSARASYEGILGVLAGGSPWASQTRGESIAAHSATTVSQNVAAEPSSDFPIDPADPVVGNEASARGARASVRGALLTGALIGVAAILTLALAPSRPSKDGHVDPPPSSPPTVIAAPTPPSPPLNVATANDRNTSTELSDPKPSSTSTTDVGAAKPPAVIKRSKSQPSPPSMTKPSAVATEPTQTAPHTPQVGESSPNPRRL